VPSPITPPAGCRFHPRCPKAQEICGIQEPRLVRYKDTGGARVTAAAESAGADAHLAACHFPVADGESLAAAGTRELA
jgi:ABC-type antimicrobial peptide transport system ATPase subunit